MKKRTIVLFVLFVCCFNLFAFDFKSLVDYGKKAAQNAVENAVSNAIDQALCSHDYVIVSSKEATIYENGYKNYQCRKCGHEKKEVIPAIDQKTCNHNFSFVSKIKEPTHIEPGLYLYVCKICGLEKKEEIPVNAEAHTWISYSVEKYPTHDEEGLRKEICSQCQETRLISIPKDTKAHNWVSGDVCSCGLELSSLLQISKSGELTVKDGTYYSSMITGSLTLPEVVNGVRVKSVGRNAFASCSGINTLVIPSEIKSFGEGAFSGEIESIKFDGFKSIPKGALSGAKNVQTVFLDADVTSISSNAFKKCENLKCISGFENLENLKEIGKSAFEGCSSLEDFVFPENLESIGDSAFADCYSLEYIVIPASVTEFGENIFDGVYAFFEFEEGTEEISELMFAESDIYGVIIPETVTKIGAEAFADCVYLESIEIPDSVIEIGDYAFDGCESLQEITMSESLERLGDYAFRNCLELSEIRFPKSLSSVGESAFKGFDSDQKVVFKTKAAGSDWNSEWNAGCKARITWGR